MNSAGPELLGKASVKLPMVIGRGFVDMSYVSDAPYLTKVSRLSELARNHALNKLIADLMLKEVAAPFHDKISFNFQVGITARLSWEVRYLYGIILEAKRRREKWSQERDRLLNQFRAAGDLLDRDRFRPFLIDYFYYCPIAAIEYTTIDSPTEPRSAMGPQQLHRNMAETGYDSELYSFALAKWQTLPESLRTKTKALWDKKGPDSFTSGGLMSAWAKWEHQKDSFYEPDWKLLIGDTDITEEHYPGRRREIDFSQISTVQLLCRALTSDAVKAWFAHISIAGIMWPYEKSMDRLYALGMLVLEDFLDSNPIQWVFRDLNEMLGWSLYENYPLGVWHDLHVAVRNNCLMHMWEKLFAPFPALSVGDEPSARPPDDQTWFRLWSLVRGEFLSSPQHEITRRNVNLPDIRELPPFFALLDRLYVRWVNVHNPHLESWNIAKIMSKSMEFWYSISGRKELPNLCVDGHLNETKGTKQLRDELMSAIASKINPVINELEWEFE